MSELINNSIKRKAILKNVLRQLHEGKTVKEVQQEFGELAREATHSEIAEIEQMLIAEGVPVSEVQRLCDVHVALFREGLDAQHPPETIPGHPVHTFIQENEAILSLLDQMQNNLLASDMGRNLVRIEAFRFLADKLALVDCHYRRKEYLLFPFLEKHGFMGPSQVMWGIHDQIRAQLKKLKELLAQNGEYSILESVFLNAAHSIREMMYKEEKILFPASLERLTEAEWAEILRQEHEFGYFLIKPGDEWQPSRVAAPQPDPRQASLPQDQENAVHLADSGQAGGNGCTLLNTGLLTSKQIDLLLRHLPIDITFVDENDLVQFYSQTRERIFDRNPAIIGRKVQNCHPPHSLDRVQRILDDFRAGTRDEASFWIHFAGKYVHIRYFAVRDENNRYCGTIEITQDIAPIQAIQGEKRLLDD